MVCFMFFAPYGLAVYLGGATFGNVGLPCFGNCYRFAGLLLAFRGGLGFLCGLCGGFFLAWVYALVGHHLKA